MDVDPKARPIASFTYRELRDLFLRSGDTVHLHRIAHLTGMAFPDAERTAQELVGAGYLTASDLGRDLFELTDLAIRLGNAKFIKRMTRAQAEELMAGLLQRAADVNRRDDLPDYVEEIYAFGSYLETGEDLGDLDIAIKLSRKEPDGRRYVEWNLALAEASGRRLSYFEQLCYGEREVHRLLKARRGRISIHTLDEVLRLGMPSRLVFSRGV